MTKLDNDDVNNAIFGYNMEAGWIFPIIASVLAITALLVIGISDLDAMEDVDVENILSGQEWLYLTGALFVVTEVLYIIFNFVAKRKCGYDRIEGFTWDAIICLKFTSLFYAFGVVGVLALSFPVLKWLYASAGIIMMVVGSVVALFGSNALITKAICYKKPDKKEEKKNA